MNLLTNPKILFLILLASTAISLISSIWQINQASIHINLFERQAGWSLTSFIILFFFHDKVLHFIIKLQHAINLKMKTFY